MPTSAPEGLSEPLRGSRTAWWPPQTGAVKTTDGPCHAHQGRDGSYAAAHAGVQRARTGPHRRRRWPRRRARAQGHHLTGAPRCHSPRCRHHPATSSTAASPRVSATSTSTTRTSGRSRPTTARTGPCPTSRNPSCSEGTTTPGTRSFPAPSANHPPRTNNSSSRSITARETRREPECMHSFGSAWVGVATVGSAEPSSGDAKTLLGWNLKVKIAGPAPTGRRSTSTSSRRRQTAAQSFSGVG
jgi:hypothetical protein